MKIKYKNSLVAFIDVLGFSNIVFSKTTEAIQNYFDYVLTEFKTDLKTYSFKFVIISDSIVISAANNRNNFEVMIKSLAKLQTKLLLRRLLIRGGISFGNLYINKSLNIIVGNGLINAYKLESKAKVPRIIIDRKLILEYFNDAGSFRSSFSTWIDYDDSNCDKEIMHYINYCQSLILIPSIKRPRFVFEWIKEQCYKSEHAPKYDWLINQLIKTMENQISRWETLETKKTFVFKRRYYNTKLFLEKYKNL